MKNGCRAVTRLIIVRQLVILLECRNRSHLHVSVIFLAHAWHGIVLRICIGTAGGATIQKERGGSESEEYNSFHYSGILSVVESGLSGKSQLGQVFRGICLKLCDAGAAAEFHFPPVINLGHGIAHGAKGIVGHEADILGVRFDPCGRTGAASSTGSE